MASIYERSNGSLYANFYEDGDRERLSLRTKDEAEAERRLRRLEQSEFDPFGEEDPSDYFGEEGDPTLSEAFKRFAESKRKQDRAESTIDSYRYTWSALTDALREGLKVDDLTAPEVENFLHNSDAARSTKCKRWRHVRAILSHFDCSDVIESVTPPTEPTRLPTPVRRDDLSALTAELKRRYRELRSRKPQGCRPGEKIWLVPLWRFAFYTGLRISELESLRWRDVDAEAGVIRLREQKNGKENATIPLTEAAATQLKYAPKPREPEAFVWRSPQGDRFEHNSKAWANVVSQTFSTTVENCDAVTEEFTFHDIRAGHASHLASNGLGAHEIRRTMRHANVSTSMQYVRVADSDLRDSMESAFS